MKDLIYILFLFYYLGNAQISVNSYIFDSSPPAPVAAFPTAYGAGAYTTGGRGGTVIHVTNLNDSGTGSFREAFTTAGTRTIVFDVSGTIEVSTPLSTAYDDVTVAGQTAPAGGITFTGNVGNNPLFELSGRDNMIFRYIRVRPEFYSGGGNADAFQCYSCTNVMVDHISVSWGGDECISFTGTTSNITVQNNIIAESKTGSIMGNSGDPSISENLSMLGNLFIQISHRFPNTESEGREDVINNVVWGYRGRTNLIYLGFPILNEINNYYITDTARPLGEMGKTTWNGTEPQIYTKGNLHLPTTVTDPNLTNNNNTWTAFAGSDGAFAFTYDSVNYNDDDAAPAAFFTSTQHTLLGRAWSIMTATESLTHAKTDVGANKTLDGDGTSTTALDDVDDYYITNVNNGTLLTVASPFTMAGKTHYDDFLTAVSSTPINTRGGSFDTDNDGMADTWETATFGDLTRTGTGDFDGDGYTDLEEYLNSLY